ncbi:MAG: hypothetical protein H5U21_09000 [Porphyrobacter sp.]|nr:hypothetical protein [Porphyrobacter sp.]
MTEYARQANETSETLNAKRYTGPWVFICAGCGSIAMSDRSDKTCCDSTCRVRAMRNGSLHGWRARALMAGLVDDRTGKPLVACLLQAEAIERLRPDDLGKQIMAGEMTIAQAQPEMVREWWRLVKANKADLAKLGAAKRAETLKQNKDAAPPVLSTPDKTDEPRHNTRAEVAAKAGVGTASVARHG